MRFWGARASRVLAMASCHRELFRARDSLDQAFTYGRLFRRDAETSTRDACAPQMLSEAMEVNRRYLAGMRADRRRRWTFRCQSFDVSDFDIGGLDAGPFAVSSLIICFG